ncbi:S8 family peptidase [Cronbergia sp. UHCC 0137]|uniref:S8 family peptidase n=1 Tax=Cronbergia sp. UHCC 0137 TaxID=3110239 RepID=UPI002B213619|nr:S8 family peptidase [Cronbergia sp. UHCC 0137]MEA5616901.1 S8 family peptidase [Cronbergia sp. UHCC 0137]
MTIDITKTFSSKQEFNVTAISSVNTFNTPVDSSLNWGSSSSFVNENIEENEAIATNNAYNPNSGYGLVNAGLSVSEAAGVAPYQNAPQLEGKNNWGLNMINAPTAWENGHTGNGIIVAVLDTGVDYNHEDLNDNIWTNTKEIPGNGIDDDGNGYVDDSHGWNFEDGNNNTLDNNGHGTHVSGTIAAENNGFGVTGVAYNSRIMPVKVLDENGSGSYSKIAKGIYYAVDNGANVINLSLGGSSASKTLQSALEYASSKGVIVVMAAGNNANALPGYPARYANKTGIAVGAVNKNNDLADFSNRSGSEELAYVTAPGVDVYSTVRDNKYAYYNGTSMATPHVAGVVALMLSANPNLTEGQVRNIIINMAENGTKVSEGIQPINPTPSNSSLLSGLGSFFSPRQLLNLFNIVSRLPLGFFRSEETGSLLPVLVSIGENTLTLQFGNASQPKTEDFSYYSENNESLVNPIPYYYDGTGSYYKSNNTELEEIFS